MTGGAAALQLDPANTLFSGGNHKQRPVRQHATKPKAAFINDQIRLNVFPVYLPPLRERKDDIPSLAYHFLRFFCRKTGKKIEGFSDDALQVLVNQHWPGNVRQLRNVIDSAVVLAVGSKIRPEDLGLRDAGTGELESLKMDFWERKLIGTALSRSSGSVPEAAKLLGIGRATLYRKIEEYGIDR